MSSIWRNCRGREQLDGLQQSCFRIVESQERVATMALCDSLEKQAILEQLLDERKPPESAGVAKRHYLIKTPFRYPPLKYGSRFGRRSQRGLFYGSLTLLACLSEFAYYRFYFFSAVAEPFPKPQVNTQHTVFTVNVRTEKGVDLSRRPFLKYRPQISSPTSYEASQALGDAMREAGVSVFNYFSSRATSDEINTGIFDIRAIRSRKPVDEQAWTARYTGERIFLLKQHDPRQRWSFPLHQFLVDGIIPAPAA